LILGGWDHGAIVTIGAIIGGLITQLLTGRQKKDQQKYDEATSMRQELRNDVSLLQSKVELLSKDLDTWKERYYKLADENINLRSRCQVLEREVGELRESLAVAHTNQALLPLREESTLPSQ
jgi:predicted  nucleic acid-binding Zn-ribbon protein